MIRVDDWMRLDDCDYWSVSIWSVCIDWRRLLQNWIGCLLERLIDGGSLEIVGDWRSVLI